MDLVTFGKKNIQQVKSQIEFHNEHNLNHHMVVASINLAPKDLILERPQNRDNHNLYILFY